MKKGKKGSVSQVSLRSAKSEIRYDIDVDTSNLDVLSVKILNIRFPDEDRRPRLVKVTFFDQLILFGIIAPIGAHDHVEETVSLQGTMNYDPSDYEKMCLFADNPLIVQMQVMSFSESPSNQNTNSLSAHSRSISPGKPPSANKWGLDVECCYVDILSLFINEDKVCVRKRLQPLYEQPVLKRKSWNNLPLISMELSVDRNPLNEVHHQFLKEANHMKVTLIASYNMVLPYDQQFSYTAVTKTPFYNEEKCSLVTFNNGKFPNRHFRSTNLFPQWETLRIDEGVFAQADDKIEYDLDSIINPDDIPLEQYIEKPSDCTVVWGSFHRTLMLGDSQSWFSKHTRKHNWPLEIHMYGENSGLSFMSFLDLFPLLYPGEDTIRMAVPLYWVNANTMQERCGIDQLMSAIDRVPSAFDVFCQSKRSASMSLLSGVNLDYKSWPTGPDGNNAFVLVEVKLARPLKKPAITPHISDLEINSMLLEIEQSVVKRECTARGQLDRDWQSTVKMASSSLKKVPYYGLTEFCAFNRQLSETRTRVEIFASCWQDAAIYVNNKFVVSEFLKSDETFEEMLLISHACLMRTACETLIGGDHWKDIDPALRAARHARQLQDVPHAVELFTQAVVEHRRSADYWRELSTCLKDVDRDWATVCLHQAVLIDPRHPLTLISMGCTAFEEDPESAEPFFAALLAFYPFWTVALVVANAYYIERQLFVMADQIMEIFKRTLSEGLAMDFGFPRNWENELGDWWDSTPLLPGMSRHYDAADLLLRLRAMPVAEVCMAQALSESGESAAYFHLVALCCRLRGDFENAICHLRAGIEKFGEISFLRSLEAECLHKLKDTEGTIASFEKSGGCIGAYSILLSMPSREAQRVRPILVDLIRRQPSAYVWIALAEDWLQRDALNAPDIMVDDKVTPKACAIACAVQALRWDRRAGRAWALLASLVKPQARRQHCKYMAQLSGYIFTDEALKRVESEQSICYTLGKPLRECRCHLCYHIRVT